MKYVLFSRQRSGSSLIGTSLDSHPEVTCAGEIFHPGNTEEESFPSFMAKQNISKLEYFLKRSTFVTRYLDRFFENGKTPVMGFKLMYSQVRWMPYEYPMVIDYIKKNNIKVVHILRKNLLDMHVSRVRALNTGVYHSNSPGLQAKGVYIEPSGLLSKLDGLSREAEKWRIRLRKFEAIEISYEDFIENKAKTSNLLLDFLAVEDRTELRSPLIKVSPVMHEESIENYDEILSVLKGSKYSGFLSN